MSPFNWLLIGHLIGDFLFQTNWMATRKEKEWVPLVVHALVYTFFIALFGIPTHSIGWVGISIIFLTHIIIDRRFLIRFWVRTIQGARGKEEGWLSIVTDQIFHLLILVLALSLPPH